MQHIGTPAEATLDSGGGHKLWSESVKRSVSHSKTPASENRPGGMCTVMTGTASWRDASSQSATPKSENAQTCSGIYSGLQNINTGVLGMHVGLSCDNK